MVSCVCSRLSTSKEAIVTGGGASGVSLDAGGGSTAEGGRTGPWGEASSAEGCGLEDGAGDGDESDGVGDVSVHALAGPNDGV